MAIAGNCCCSPLPVYTPSAPSPKYSCKPACDEQVLQKTPCMNRCPPTGTFTLKSGKVTVTFFEQEDNAKMPTYNQRGLVTGTIHLEDHELISDVVLKIEGKLESSSTEGGANSIQFLNDRYALWSAKDHNCRCPSLLAFSCVLPSTYDDGSSKFPFPPSFSAQHSGRPFLFVQSQYSIIVSIEGARNRKVGLFNKTKIVKIPFKYHPRVRAHRPILPNLGFFPTIKTAPEEWYQVFHAMKTRPPSQLEPVNAHLLIPGARAYGLTDRIPFHVQLAGPLPSLQQFFAVSQHNCKGSYSGALIRVFLQRMIAVETRGQKSACSSTLGEGQLDEIPPLPCAPCGCQDTIHLDWEGEVRWTENVSVGGFSAGNIEVKDFIVLEIEPPKHRKQLSPFFGLRMSVPIKFVTDSYAEATDYDRTLQL